MKASKWFVYISLFIFPLLVSGQENDYETIGKKKGDSSKVKISGFGSLLIDFGGFNDKLSINLGAEGALLIDRSFYIGFYGKGMASFPRFEAMVYSADSMKNLPVSGVGTLYQGGLLIGGEFFAKKPFHFGVSAKIGGGGFGLGFDRVYLPETPYGDDWNSNGKYGFKHLFSLFVFTPQADFIMNITNWFKIRIGIGYQWVSNGSINYLQEVNGQIVEKEALNASQLRTVVGSIRLSFGGFK